MVKIECKCELCGVEGKSDTTTLPEGFVEHGIVKLTGPNVKVEAKFMLCKACGEATLVIAKKQ